MSRRLLGRRVLVRGGLAGAAVAGMGAAPDADDRLAAIERRHGGRLGVFALDTGTGRTLQHRADERFLLCSSWKALVAALVLHRVDRGQDRLTTLLPYDARDLLPHSPVTAAHVAAGALSLGVLCAAVVEWSDNCGANLLLRHVGGPASVTRFLREVGDHTTRLDRYELAMNDAHGDWDTTTPRAISTTARTLLLGDALLPASRGLLERRMVDCRTGLARLRAEFPPDWVAADKTGTSSVECNDFALARRPRAAPLVMAVYYNNPPGMDDDTPEAVLRNASAVIVRWSAG